jgi:cell division protein FtsW
MSVDTPRRDRSVATLVDRHRSGPWSSAAIALAVITGLLLLVGIVMSFSASIVDAAQDGDPFGLLRRQVAWAAIGIPAFLLVAGMDHRVWRRLSWVLLAIAMVGLLLLLIPGVGLTRGGATRWLALGPIVAQPSELAKLAVLLWLADVHQRKRPRDGSPLPVPHLLVPSLPALAIVGGLILLQPDLGTTFVLGIIVALVLWVDGLPFRLFGAVAVVGLTLSVLLAFVAAYRVDRITGWLHPEADPTGTGFQLLQSLYALGSGGVFGVGLGSSRGKWNLVPNPETDFVFAIIGEELGLIGALGVLVLFGAFLVVGLRVAQQATGYAQTVAFGITGWIVGQAMINVATVVGLLPITGMTLPLVSAGGSSLLATLVAIGILVSIARDLDATEAP